MDRWQDSLELSEEYEELKSNPELDRFKTLGDALASIPEAKAYRGSSIRIPAQDAPPEDMQKWEEDLRAKVPNLARIPSDLHSEEAKPFWKSLGAKEKKEDYVNPEGFKGLPDELIVQFQEAALRSGMPLAQYQEQLKYFAEVHANVNEANTTAKEASQAELKTLWGPAYEENMAVTEELVTRHNEEHPEHPFGELNNAARLFLLDQAKKLSSDPQVRNQVNTPAGKRTPAELREDYRRLLEADVHKNPTKYSRQEKENHRLKLLKYHELLAPYGGVS